MARPSLKSMDVESEDIKQETPKPTGVNRPSLAIITKKIKKNQEFTERERKKNGEVYIFELTGNNNQIYLLKGETSINIPHDWQSNPAYKEYIELAFGGKSPEDILTGERTIKVVRGENTIFLEYQNNQDKKYETIVFKSGVRGEKCKIAVNNKKQPNMFAYLMMSNRNADNPFAIGRPAFKIVSKQKEAVKRIANERVRFSAISWVMNQDESQIMGVAAVLGLIAPTVEIMRDNILQFAYSDPDKLMSVIDDDLLPVKSTYILAKQLGIIELDGQIVKWRNTNGVLQVIPHGQQSQELEIMASWLNSEDGEPAYRKIIELINSDR